MQTGLIHLFIMHYTWHRSVYSNLILSETKGLRATLLLVTTNVQHSFVYI